MRNQQSLSKLLSQKGFICDLPTHVLPKSLKGRHLSTGSGIKIGRSTGVVEQELGRGVYGIVALLEVDATEDTVAVKAQSPADCLAWEYEILQKISERVEKHLPKGTSFFPFPRPLSYVSLADGALFSMTAGSRSGLNLLDLINVYTVKMDEKVPEIIALHYTARMLSHLEQLHWYGKILVSSSNIGFLLLQFTSLHETPAIS